jgi:hypothetical protein
MTDGAVTWANEGDRRKDLRRRRIADVKWNVWMFAHKIFWRTLHAMRLARTYSVIACRLNLYRRYPDGRCGWCGKGHHES